MNLERYIKTAISEAEKSSHRQRLGAVIFKGKVEISKGYNHSERSVRSFNRKFIRWPFSIHAELAAICSARTDLKGCSILVVRLNRKGELRYAKPCAHCLAYINFVLLRHVYFSTSEGKVIEL